MRHQFNFVRIEEIRAMLAEIEAADSAETLGALYLRHIGHNPFVDPDPEDCLEDLEDVQMTLTDYIKEAAISEGFHWSEIADVECR